MSENSCSNKKYKRIRIIIYLVLGAIFTLSSVFSFSTYAVKFTEKLVSDDYSATSMIILAPSDNCIIKDTGGFSINREWFAIASCSDGARELVPSGYTVSLDQVQDTNILSIIVKGKDPQVCADTSNSVSEYLCEELKPYFEHNNVAILARATVPTVPTSDFNGVTKTIIKAVACLVLIAIYIICITFIEKTITKELKDSCKEI